MSYNKVKKALIDEGYVLIDKKYGNKSRNFWMTKVTTPGGGVFGLEVKTDSDYASVTLLEACKVEDGEQSENVFHPTVGGKIEFVCDKNFCTIVQKDSLPKSIQMVIWPSS